MYKYLVSISVALMLAGPLMRGLISNIHPQAYIFAPILLAGLAAILAGKGLGFDLRLAAQAILICGATAVGLWYVGTFFGPVAIPSFAPVGVAIAGALTAAAGNLPHLRSND